MIGKYWDLNNLSLASAELKDGDLIAYGTTPPPTNIC